jgi:hypothetical protein
VMQTERRLPQAAKMKLIFFLAKKTYRARL